MSSEPSQPGFPQRRQFGRRETSRAAYAMLPGGSAVACTVSNLSEGGALVEFAGAAVPTRNFRLTIDGTPYTLVCEIRHQGPSSVGVRFLNAADGSRLMAHLYPGPAIAPDGDSRQPRTDAAPAPMVNGLDLRRHVLSSIAARAETPPVPPTASPSLTDLPLKLWKNLIAFKGTTASAAPDIKSELSVEPSLPIAPSVDIAAAPAPQPELQTFQPRRSRKNGIKGRSAGGIG